MSKIKEIRERLTRKPEEYTTLRFSVAKRLFAGMAALYFLVYLFTVGGFYFGPFSLETLSILRYHLHSLLILASMFFLYALIEYWAAVYANNSKSLIVVGAIISILGAIIPLSTHLWLFTA